MTQLARVGVDISAFMPLKSFDSLSNTSFDIEENYSYVYDDDRRIIRITSFVDSALGCEITLDLSDGITYAYDSKGQLVSSENSTNKNEYTYDS